MRFLQEGPYIPYVTKYVQLLKDFEDVESAASAMAKSAVPKASAKAKSKSSGKAKAKLLIFLGFQGYMPNGQAVLEEWGAEGFHRSITIVYSLLTCRCDNRSRNQ